MTADVLAVCALVLCAAAAARSTWSPCGLSMLATIAAAVVKEPAGSANSDMANGGTIAAFAFFIMSRASDTFLPAKNMASRTPAFGGREKIASCTKPVTSSSVTLV